MKISLTAIRIDVRTGGREETTMTTWMNMHKSLGIRTAGRLLVAACLLAIAPAFHAAALDICGCATIQGLHPFDTSDPTTYPPGTSDQGNTGTLTIPLPADGVLKFSSVRIVNRHVRFVTNAVNTPITILVAGDALLQSTFGCCFSFSVSGNNGSGGSSQVAGVGGLGGPGGFRGGDGAAQAINGAAIGGAGFGPGGGLAGSVNPLTTAGGGTFLGLPELTPLLGGSGGGGGASSSASSTSCSGGGGGGGGGALLIAANGSLTIDGYQLFADGGNAAGPGDGSCASAGGGGSGGAIRLVANSIAAPDSSGLFARGLNNGGGDGRIRLESVDTSAQTQFNTSPTALRIVGPTPLTNPINPTVTITSVAGAAVPAVPQGTFGAIDVVVPAPGSADVAVATSGVPSGTTVSISVKPRIGGQSMSQVVPLSGCTTAGVCGAAATFNLAAGAYVVEARATFQIP